MLEIWGWGVKALRKWIRELGLSVMPERRGDRMTTMVWIVKGSMERD